MNTSKQKEHISDKKVFVGMSGGVDSAVSALLLKQAGYSVTGVFIKVWQPDSTDCGWKDERRDAMRVAAVLDIPFETLDLSATYKNEVADYMISEYQKGRTPNPDIMCNRYVKFGSFWEYAKSKGADYVATGHYAQSIQNQQTGIFEMHEGVDTTKDQSYFLWTLTEQDLEHILFPIGHLWKSEVREIAGREKLPVFDKKDSQGVCFIGHLDMKEFLKEYIPQVVSGDVLDVSGKVIGTHDGAILYTFGERHGFQISNKNIDSEPRFVVDKDIVKNTITVATEGEIVDIGKNSQLTDTRELSGIQIAKDMQTVSMTCDSRIRYRQERQKATLKLQLGSTSKKISGASVQFDVAQKGLAPGQSIVFYSGSRCIGGAILEK